MLGNKQWRNYLWLMVQLTGVLIVTAVVFRFPPIVLLISLIVVLGPSSLIVAFLNQRQRAALEQKGKSGDRGSAEQSLSLEIDVSLEQAHSLCMEALRSLDGRTAEGTSLIYRLNMHQTPQESLSSSQPIQASLYFHSRLSRSKRRGIRLAIYLTEVRESLVRIHIELMPIMQTAFIDFGHSQYILTEISHYLRRENARLTGAGNLRLQDEALDPSDNEITDAREAQR